jgi:hypothetical protein
MPNQRQEDSALIEGCSTVVAAASAASRNSLESLENRFRSFTLWACPENDQAIAQ